MGSLKAVGYSDMLPQLLLGLLGTCRIDGSPGKQLRLHHNLFSSSSSEPLTLTQLFHITKSCKYNNVRYSAYTRLETIALTWVSLWHLYEVVTKQCTREVLDQYTVLVSYSTLSGQYHHWPLKANRQFFYLTHAAVATQLHLHHTSDSSLTVTPLAKLLCSNRNRGYCWEHYLQFHH